MAVRTVQVSFSAGELDAELAARSDVERYYRGLERARNVRVLPTGGLTRRPGLRHVATLADGAAGLRLVPFSFNTEQAYLLAFTANTIRVFRNDVLVATIAATPWSAAQVGEIGWTQSADTLIVTHPDVQPHRLLRGGSHSSWTLSPIALSNVPGFDYGAVTPAGTITPSATTGEAVTLTASVATFTAGMVGWYVRTLRGALARITAFTSATAVTARVLRAFASTAAIAAADWRITEPVISAARGWPARAIFYQGRLFLGGLKARPATLLGSKVGEFFDLDPGSALDDEGLDVTIDTDQVNAIRQLAATRQLHAFTSGGEHILAGDADGVLTPKSVRWIEQTRRGCVDHVPVVEVDGALHFVQRGGRAVRQHLYDEIQAAYSNLVLSRLSGHLIRQPVDMAVRKGATDDASDNVLVVNADGTVAVLMVERNQDTVAWTLWETAGQVRRVAALDDGSVYLAVLRDGSARIETWDDGALADAAVRVTTGLPASTITGLGHLEGEEVVVIADGSVLSPRTVAGGAITIERPAEAEAQVGLRFEPQLRPMIIEPRSGAGALMGSVARITRVTARVLDTGPFEINGTALDFRRFGDAPASPLDAPPPRVTADVRISGFPGWTKRPAVEIAQREPAPFTLLALAYDVAM